MNCYFCNQPLKRGDESGIGYNIACYKHESATVTHGNRLHYVNIEKEFENKIISFFLAFEHVALIDPNHMEIGYFTSRGGKYNKICVVPIQKITPENCQELFKRIMEMKAFL